MSTIDDVRAFCESLSRHRIRYHLDIIRDGSIMVSLAVPGERWEIEFLIDGSVELERFASTGVAECVDPLGKVLTRYE